LVARRARELLGASLAILATPEPLSGCIAVRVAEGEQAEVVLGMALPETGSICGDVVRSGGPFVLDGVSGAHGGDPLVARLADVGAALFVPLIHGAEVFGTLVLVNRRGEAAFADDAVALAHTFAADAAAALCCGRVRSDLGRLSILEER
jgi:GAF domain-containing protein